MITGKGTVGYHNYSKQSAPIRERCGCIKAAASNCLLMLNYMYVRGLSFSALADVKLVVKWNENEFQPVSFLSVWHAGQIQKASLSPNMLCLLKHWQTRLVVVRCQPPPPISLWLLQPSHVNTTLEAAGACQHRAQNTLTYTECFLAQFVFFSTKLKTNCTHLTAVS